MRFLGCFFGVKTFTSSLSDLFWSSKAFSSPAIVGEPLTYDWMAFPFSLIVVLFTFKPFPSFQVLSLSAISLLKILTSSTRSSFFIFSSTTCLGLAYVSAKRVYKRSISISPCKYSFSTQAWSRSSKAHKNVLGWGVEYLERKLLFYGNVRIKQLIKINHPIILSKYMVLT